MCGNVCVFFLIFSYSELSVDAKLTDALQYAH
jgi:hypothetical protein